MKRNALSKLLIGGGISLTALLPGIASAQATSGSHVQYGITYNTVLSRYEVYYQTNSLAPANPPTTSTAQLFIVIPDAQNGSASLPNGRYTIDSFTINTSYANGTWAKGDYVNGPVEKPGSDYFGVYLSSTGTTAIELNATNTPAMLFSFTLSGPCPGNVAIIEDTDPFYFDPLVDFTPNSLSLNVNNNFDVLFPTASPSTWNPGYLSNYNTGTGPCTTILPVHLLAFNALKQDKVALLDWRTGTEQNTDYFGVEKSMDGREWITMSKLPAAGESAVTRLYTYTDEQPGTGANYYRLRITDKDGAFTYTEVRKLVFGAGGNDDIRLYPNPASGSVKFMAGDMKTADIMIYTTDGRLVISQPAFNLDQNLDISRLPAGNYQVKMISSNKMYVRSLVVNR